MPSLRARSAPAPAAPGQPATGSLVAAFAAVYVIWGSTYLAIRWAIETTPPLLMAAARFLLAGGMVYAWVRARGARRPTGAEWRAAAIAGGLMLGGGNGGVVVAEQWVPSGMAALLVASVPLWLVGLDALFGSRRRPSRRAQLGLLGGFAGVALLGGAPGTGAGGPEELLGALIVLAGCASWAAGSLYVQRAPKPSEPLTWVAMQMITGGAVLAVASLALGEPAALELGAVSVRSALAFAYLVVFGSLVAYSAYVWLLHATTPARVGTYAYVNPVIALLLGWGLAGEPLGGRSLLAAAVIVGSVVLIVSESAGGAPRGGARGTGAGAQQAPAAPGGEP
ncbi:MAG TPA: EamA family transporter [Longimicrobiales bacterium]|nr:EamA family transporter [Longimicrobiales bacterium]